MENHEMGAGPRAGEIVCFRVDKRPLDLGKDFTTAGEFAGLHPEHGKRAEAFLEEHRPANKPTRSSCLMLFDSDADARFHCAKMSGASLYEVKISESDILHRGDMNIIDNIGRIFKNNGAPAIELANLYWSSQFLQDPIIEILLLSGKPTRKLNFDRTAYWKAKLDIPPPEPLDIAHLFDGNGRAQEE